MKRRMFLASLAALVAVQVSPARAQRYYWPVSLDSLAIGHTTHTHVAVRGLVAYVRAESDSDVHIKLVSPSGRFIIAECIPSLPCQRPKVGSTVTVMGISRRDPEHQWWECHPVESWEYVSY